MFRLGGHPDLYHILGRELCMQAGEDLNGWLVRQGYGVAYRKYSLDYVPQEKAAHKEQLGLWSGRFVMPWLWRRGERLP